MNCRSPGGGGDQPPLDHGAWVPLRYLFSAADVPVVPLSIWVHSRARDRDGQLRRLLGACSSHGLLIGQLLFSVAFVGSCELPNWLVGPHQMNGCLERWMRVSALFFPSGLRNGAGADGTAGGIAPVAAGETSRSKRGLAAAAPPPMQATTTFAPWFSSAGPALVLLGSGLPGGSLGR